jgi:glycosyltransferase involved in cell wall biosynthesis
MNVAFVNENTLGHTSYLPRFVDALNSHPEWGCSAIRVDATPLPQELRGSEKGIRGLSRLGLDWQITRWRRAASANAAAQLTALSKSARIDAIVVNTQSVGLDIPRMFPGIPCWVALDATFEELARSRWFRPTRLAGWFHPITLRWLRQREKLLFSHAQGFLPWSRVAAESLRREYKIRSTQIHQLPPSLEDPAPAPYSSRRNTKPNILFIGGDFKRKGGQQLVEVWRTFFRNQSNLHIVTREEVVAEEGLHVHRGVEAGSARWRELWNTADVFVFPSHMETFGIVLIEAMAFGVPIVSANTGAAQDLLEDGLAGILLDSPLASALQGAIQGLISDKELRSRISTNGRNRFLRDFELEKNAKRLAQLVRGT